MNSSPDPLDGRQVEAAAPDARGTTEESRTVVIDVLNVLLQKKTNPFEVRFDLIFDNFFGDL